MFQNWKAIKLLLSLNQNLILAGNIEGIESNMDNVITSVLNLIAGSSLNKNESIFYIDEGKKEK